MLLLLLVLLDAPAPPSSAVVRTIDFAALTEQHESSLVGRRARYRVKLDSAETIIDDAPCFDCQAHDNNHLKGIRFVIGTDIAPDAVDIEVEAEIRIRHFGRWGQVPPFVQIELLNAIRVR